MPAAPRSGRARNCGCWTASRDPCTTLATRRRRARSRSCWRSRASGEAETACRALGLLSYTAQLDGDLERSAACCHEALEVAESSGDAHAALEARVAAYWHAFASRDLPRQDEHLERALEVARQLGDRGRLASLLRLSAQEALRRGQLEESTRLALEARAAFAALGDRDNESEALGWASWSATLGGRPHEGLRLARAGLAVADAVGHPLRRAENLQLVALASLETGALGAAADAAERALAITRADERHLRHQRGLIIAARVAYQLWDTEAAAEHVLDCERVTPGVRWLSEATGVLRCAVALIQGDLEAAGAAALEAARATIPQFPAHLVPTWLQAEALLAAGEPELARASVARLEAYAENPRVRVAFLRSRAVLEREWGDVDQALASLHKALEQAVEIGLPVERWGIEAELARLLETRRDLAGASDARVRAKAVAAELAATIGDAESRRRFVEWTEGQRSTRSGRT